MAQERTSSSVPVADRFPQLPTPAAHLTDLQLDRLDKCAHGNTLRFEAVEIVNALVAGGYAKEGIGCVVSVTAKGRQYLATLAVRLRLQRLNTLR